MPYAANIADMTAHKRHPADTIPLMLVCSVLDMDPERVIECERGKAVGLGHGMLFLCEDKRAKAIIAVIRQKYKRYQWRFYQQTKRGWKRV